MQRRHLLSPDLRRHLRHSILASTPLAARLWHRLPKGFVRVAAPALILLALVLSTAYLVDATYNPFLYLNF